MRAAAALAHETGTTIAGGDVVGAPVLIVSVTAVGWAERVEALIGRDGARPGGSDRRDRPAGCARRCAGRDGRTRRHTSAAEAALARSRRPRPRLAEGRALAAAAVHAMIDLSDGLATDAGHIGRRSGVSLRVDLAALPLHEGVGEIAAELHMPPWRLAAGGGEDYELCFCAAPEDRERVEAAVGDLGSVEVRLGRRGARRAARSDAVRRAGRRYSDRGIRAPLVAVPARPSAPATAARRSAAAPRCRAAAGRPRRARCASAARTPAGVWRR